jgi:hypothetical protein
MAVAFQRVYPVAERARRWKDKKIGWAFGKFERRDGFGRVLKSGGEQEAIAI